MDEKMRLYSAIGWMRGLNVRIFDNDSLIYDGNVDEAPEEIKKWKYSKISLKGNYADVYVYDIGKK